MGSRPECDVTLQMRALSFRIDSYNAEPFCGDAVWQNRSRCADCTEGDKDKENAAYPIAASAPLKDEKNRTKTEQIYR